MTRRRFILISLTLAAFVGAVAFAQRGPRGSGRGPGGRGQSFNQDQSVLPTWENDKLMPHDVFTFVRIQYSTAGRGRFGGFGGGRGGYRWHTDAPDADMNLGYRLQQMTSLKVHSVQPDEIGLELTDPKLFSYPFIYIVEPGDLSFSDEEATILRKYLLNGGFLMVDDFWGDSEYEGFYEAIKKAFPDREPQELEMSHPIFHTVFDLKMKKNEMQIPNVTVGTASQFNEGVTWEDHHDGNVRDVHFKGIFDDKGRMMVMICHNTDNGDGWEWEGNNIYYFREFAEKKAYPLMINIVFYAMTH